MLKGIFRRVAEVFRLRRPLSEDFFIELEEALVASDVSVHTTTALVDYLEKETRRQGINEVEPARELMKAKLVEILTKSETKLNVPASRPGLYLMVGVNGTGKTTTIAKLAYREKQRGTKVLLSAADTFRAAAIEQLEVWGERLDVPVIKGRFGGDPAAVVFDSIQAAQARDLDLVIADTAGRLHTKHNLMDELRKINRISADKLGRNADETLLVLDATTGQNAILQAKEFSQVTNLTGIVLTKLDSTAKGGIVITIADEMGLPIKLIGTGEKPTDLADFNASDFADALLGDVGEGEPD